MNLAVQKWFQIQARNRQIQFKYPLKLLLVCLKNRIQTKFEQQSHHSNGICLFPIVIIVYYFVKMLLISENECDKWYKRLIKSTYTKCDRKMAEIQVAVVTLTLD